MLGVHKSWGTWHNLLKMSADISLCDPSWVSRKKKAVLVSGTHTHTHTHTHTRLIHFRLPRSFFLNPLLYFALLSQDVRRKGRRRRRRSNLCWFKLLLLSCCKETRSPFARRTFFSPMLYLDGWMFVSFCMAWIGMLLIQWPPLLQIHLSFELRDKS